MAGSEFRRPMVDSTASKSVSVEEPKNKKVPADNQAERSAESSDQKIDAATVLSEEQTQPGDKTALKVARERNSAAPSEFGNFEIVGSDDKGKVAPTLDKATLEKQAKALHEAINAGGWFASDVEKINRILEPLSVADRKALELTFREQFGKGSTDENFLRSQLRSNLGAVDFRRAEAVLDRQDGKTNDAGALQVALTTMSTDPERGNRELRDVLKTLTAEQLKSLDQDFKSRYGTGYRAAIENAKGLSPENRESLDVLTRGSDKRTSADFVVSAQVALQHNNKEIFGQLTGGDSPAAQAARLQLRDDPAFMAKFNERYSNDQVMKDYLQDGRVSLATIAKSNSDSVWFLNNKDNILLAAKNASEKEQRDFAAGRALALQKKEPTNDEEKRALEFYNKLHKAFENSGNSRDLAALEDQVLRKGSIVSDIVDSYDSGFLGIGSGTKKQDLFNKLENLSEADWKRLKDPATSAGFRHDIEQALETFADEGEKRRALKLIDEKTGAATFEESKLVRRTVVDTIKDNTGSKFLGLGTSYDSKAILEKIATMPPAEANKYRTDKEYRTQIDAFVSENLNDTEKQYAQRILNRTMANRVPTEQEKQIDKIYANSVNGEKREIQMRDVEALLKSKEVRDRLNKAEGELSTEDLYLKKLIENQIVAAAYNMSKTPPDLERSSIQSRQPYVERLSKPLFEEGRLPVDLKLQLGFSKKDMLTEIAAPNVPVQEREAAMKRLDENQRKIVENAVLQNGKMDLADRVRSFVISDDKNYAQFKTELEKLSNADKQKLKDDYARKYGTVFDDDFLKKVDVKEQVTYKTLVTPAEADSRQNFYDLNKQRLDNSGGATFDGTELTLERATQLYSENLEKYGGTLPPETRKQLDEYYSESLKQYKDSKEKLAEIAADAAITAVAITATIASGGVLGPAAIAAMAASGAALRIGIKKGIQGNSLTLDAKTISTEGAIGALTGALAAVGPETIALISKTGTAAVASAGRVLATESLEQMAKQGVLNGGKEAAELALSEKIAKVLTNSLVNGEKVGVRQVDDMAKGLLNSTTQAALKSTDPVVREAAEQQLKLLSSSIQHELGNAFTDKVGQTGREWLTDMYVNTVLKSARNNAIVGGAANVASEPFYSFLKGEGISYDKLMQGGFTGLAMGAIAPVAFKGAFKAVEVGVGGASRMSEVAGNFVTNLQRGENGTIQIDPVKNPHVSKLEVPGKNPGEQSLLINLDEAVASGKPVTVPEGATPVMRTNAKGELIDRSGVPVNADGSSRVEVVRADNVEPAPVNGDEGMVRASDAPENALSRKIPDNVTVDDAGNVKKVVNPDGGQVQFFTRTVDGKTELAEAIYIRPLQPGETQAKPSSRLYSENGKWYEHVSGRQPQLIDGAVNGRVDNHGNVILTFNAEAKERFLTRLPGGDSVREFKNNVQLHTEADGKLVSVTDKQGVESRYELAPNQFEVTKAIFKDEFGAITTREMVKPGEFKVTHPDGKTDTWYGVMHMQTDHSRLDIMPTDTPGYRAERHVKLDDVSSNYFIGPDGKAVAEIPPDAMDGTKRAAMLKNAYEELGVRGVREPVISSKVDGGFVTKDASGKIIETTADDGLVRRFAYNDSVSNPQINQITELRPSLKDPTVLEPSQVYVKSTKGWEKYTPGKTTPEIAPQAFLLNQDGSLEHRGNWAKDVKSVTKHLDGNYMLLTKDDAHTLYDPANKLIGVRGRDGRMTRFEYGPREDGGVGVNKITSETVNGTVLKERTATDQWTITLPGGKKELFKGEIELHQDGTRYEYSQIANKNYEITRINRLGEKEIYFQDSNSIRVDLKNFRDFDAKGRLSTVVDANGSGYKFRYNDDGTVSEFNWPSQKSWQQLEGKPTTYVDLEGNEYQVTKFAVEPDGEIRMTVDGSEWRIGPDGSRTISGTNLHVEYGADNLIHNLRMRGPDSLTPDIQYSLGYTGGKLSSVVTPDGSFAFHSDGFVYQQPSGAKLGTELSVRYDGVNFASSTDEYLFKGLEPSSDGFGGAHLFSGSETKRSRGIVVEGMPEGIDPYSIVGDTDSFVGALVENVGRRQRTLFNVDGSRTDSFNGGSSIIYGRDGEIIGVRPQNGPSIELTRTDGELTRVKFDNQTLSRESTGKWVSKSSDGIRTVVAEDIVMLPNGTLRVRPTADLRMPQKPDNAIHYIDYPLSGKRDIGFKEKVYVPKTHEEASPKRLLELRGRDKLPSSIPGEIHFSTTRGEMKRRSDGSRVETDVSGATRQWDKNGRVVTTKNSAGSEFAYSYDRNGRLSSVEISRDGQQRARYEVERTTDKNGIEVEQWFSVNQEGRKPAVGKLSVTNDGALQYEKSDFSGIREELDGVRVTFDKNLKETIEGTPKNIEIQKQNLAHLRDVLYKDPERRARFDELMAGFEKRMNDRPSGDVQSEIANTYFALRKMLTADEAAISSERRAILAEQLLFMLNKPHLIDQGALPTCNVTAEVITRLFTKNPSEGIRLVTEPAVSGRYISSEGVIIDMREIRGGLEPRGEAADTVSGVYRNTNVDIKRDGHYNYAEWIAMATSINVDRQSRVFDPSAMPIRRATTIDELRAGVPYHPGDMRYDYQRKVKGWLGWRKGEEVVLTSRGQHLRSAGSTREIISDPITGAKMKVNDGARIQSPDLSDYDLVQLSSKILGKQEPVHYLNRMNGGMQSENGMRNILLNLQKDGELPATLRVDTRHPPFIYGKDHSDANAPGGAHVVMVHKIYQDVNGNWRVNFSNQWGSHSNFMPDNPDPTRRNVSLSQLYKATEDLQAPPVKEDQFDKIGKEQRQAEERRRNLYRRIASWPMRIFSRDFWS